MADMRLEDPLLTSLNEAELRARFERLGLGAEVDEIDVTPVLQAHDRGGSP